MGGRGLSGGGVRVDANEELKFWGKFKKKIFWGGMGGGRVVGGRGQVGRGQGGCERSIKVFGKIQKKKINFFWGGGG